MAGKIAPAGEKFAYITVVDKPDPDNPDITSGKYYRWVDDTGFVYKRVELYAGSACREIYVQNKSGQYGTIGNISAPMLEVLILSRLDLLFREFNEIEILFSKYVVEEDRYRDIPCYKLTISDPADPILVAGMSQISIDQVKAPNSDFNRQRPARRVLWIGKRDNVVYARKHYNRQGRLLLAVEIGKLEKSPDLSPALFPVPENLSVTTPLFRYDLQRLAQSAALSRPNAGQSSMWTNFANRIFSAKIIDVLSPVFVGIALILFAVIVRIKWKEKRRK